MTTKVEHCYVLHCKKPAVFAIYPGPYQDGYLCAEHAKSEGWAENTLYRIGHDVSVAIEKKQAGG